MLGAIIGDIAGSRFEWNNIKNKEFELFTDRCFFTDDTVMTVAVAAAILETESNGADLGKVVVSMMQNLGRLYPGAGYGGMFTSWLMSDKPEPYNSYGNGAAMRVSPCGFAASSLEEAKRLSRQVTEVTHNHPEGIKGAEATTAAIFLAREGYGKEEIRSYVDQYYYKLDFTLDDIREDYTFDVTCQGTVPEAITAFLESASFEDAIRNAVSIGGDSDTLAAITGGIAEAFYGIPEDIRGKGISYLDAVLLKTLAEFENLHRLRRKSLLFQLKNKY